MLDIKEIKLHCHGKDIKKEVIGVTKRLTKLALTPFSTKQNHTVMFQGKPIKLQFNPAKGVGVKVEYPTQYSDQGFPLTADITIRVN